MTAEGILRQVFYWLYGLPEWASSIIFIIASISLLFMAWHLHGLLISRRNANNPDKPIDEPLLIIGISGSVLGILLALLMQQFGQDYAVMMLASEPPTGAGNVNRETSPLGMNLSPVEVDSDEFPFLDLFKTSHGWIPLCEPGDEAECPGPSGSGEITQIDLDQDGWVRHLPMGSATSRVIPVATTVRIPLNPESDGYSGRWVVLYDGEGEITYSSDGAKISGAPGRDVVMVEPGGKLQLIIARTDPTNAGKYIRNIRIVREEQESLLASQVFNTV
ncbi:MAG: hypothetical protein ACKN9W_15830 [Methylococcus sp.]